MVADYLGWADIVLLDSWTRPYFYMLILTPMGDGGLGFST